MPHVLWAYSLLELAKRKPTKSELTMKSNNDLSFLPSIPPKEEGVTGEG